jgi:NifU-like protein involved in Fe-S cluster formation
MDYTPAVLARFDAPPGAGPVAPGPGVVVTGRAGGVAEGADVAFELRIEAERIAGAAFRAWGCPHTIAACSLVTERLVGLPAESLREGDPAAWAAELRIPAAKRGRLLCIEDALRSCWRAWENKRLAALRESRSDP